MRLPLPEFTASRPRHSILLWGQWLVKLYLFRITRALVHPPNVRLIHCSIVRGKVPLPTRYGEKRQTAFKGGMIPCFREHEIPARQIHPATSESPNGKTRSEYEAARLTGNS